MNFESSEHPKLSTDSCGCSKPSRRICDVCQTPTHVFTACSAACLSEHLKSHGPLPEIVTRFRRLLREMNHHSDATRARYASHRRHLMALVPRRIGGKLCLLGAGSGSDIDLEEFARTFSEIHLVDFDGDAIERARDRQPRTVKSRITLHPELDLSGFLDRLDAWGDRFPDPASLGPAAVAAASRIVQALGRTFDVCVSTCVLSQLANPFRRTWALPPAEWVALDAALTGVHLTTLAGATHSGGKGLLAIDVLTSDREPALRELVLASDAEVAVFAQSALDAGKLWPNPQQLLRQLGSPGLARVLASPRASAPWLWDITDGVQLVYGLTFDRL